MKHTTLIRFASRVSNVISHPLTFVIVMILMGAWLAAWAASGFPDTWRHMQSVVTSAVTFTLLFILNHNQRRDKIVTHIKLDELIRANEGAHNAILDLERLTEQDIEYIQSGYVEIAARARDAGPRIVLPVCRAVPPPVPRLPRTVVPVPRRPAAASAPRTRPAP